MKLGKAYRNDAIQLHTAGRPANQNIPTIRQSLSETFKSRSKPIGLADIEITPTKQGSFVNIPHGEGRSYGQATLTPNQVFELMKAKAPYDIPLDSGGRMRFLKDSIRRSDSSAPSDDAYFNDFGDITFEELQDYLRSITEVK